MSIDWDRARAMRDEVAKWPAWKRQAARSAFQQPKEKQVSEQPIKLTDDIIDHLIARAVDAYSGYDSQTANQVTAAIRELRDRAKAVVDSEHDEHGWTHGASHVVSGRALRALEEVLP